MSGKIRYPNITAGNDAAQLLQVKSYLHQLVDQLNWALNAVETQPAGTSGVTVTQAGSASTEDSPQATFNSIKSLIIKSADIVNAYYEVINKRLEGMYVAQSDFGTYAEKTSQDITANSTNIESNYSHIQEIISDIENVENTLIGVTAHIKSGLLYYDDDGVPMYGLEIGQKTERNGVEVFNKYARFTSDRLSFFDQNDNEVAYISDKKLYIGQVEVTVSFQMGGFRQTVLSDKSIVKKWVGTGG